MSNDPFTRYRAIPVIVYAKVHALQTREDHVEEVLCKLRSLSDLTVVKADDFRDVTVSLDSHWEPRTALPTEISSVCPSVGKKMSLHEKLSNTIAALLILILLFIILSLVELTQTFQ